MSATASVQQRVIVLGGTSEIALAIVSELQRRAPREVVLAARDRNGLQAAAEELRSQGCTRVSTIEFDALDIDSHVGLVDRAFAEHGGGEIVILAVGVLGQRGGLPADLADAVEVMQVNFVAAGSLLICAARRLRDGKGGTIIVLSSAAGARPRRANVVYGAAKAGLDFLARGLGDDLHDDGVRVLVVRPGFVHTRMTVGLEPAPMASTPQAVARDAVDALGTNRQVLWSPRGLRWPMLVIRALPRVILRRMRR